MTDYKELINKRVKIYLKKENIIFSGRVLSVGDTYLKIYDKFEKMVYIPLDNISSIEEEK
jgi:ASC-1-like (ASCH) protein